MLQKYSCRTWCSGQVLTEFAMMLALLAAIAGMMLLLLAVLAEYGWRLLSLAAWEPFT